jgi:group II intron reverse transcriptase/maturase
VQAAVVVVLTPIFEADLRPEQYGFRPRVDAKAALRQVHQHLTLYKRTHVVDADLTDYFNTIPHGPLMKCVARRVADGTLLSTIKAWLEAAVVEREGNREQRSTEARDRNRGTPQGGVISPLLANLYFRRFVLAWQRSREAELSRGAIVNYADDLVICCAPGTGNVAMNKMRELMQRLGLNVNETKTRLVDACTGRFDFLGYTVGQFYGRHGKSFLGTAPSKKSIKRVRKAIHEETSRRWNTTTVEERVRWINQILRGWCGYFNQGPVQTTYKLLSEYTERRLRRWLMRKHKRRGTGYRQYTDEMLYKQFGLYKPTAPGRRQLSAKA